MITWVNQSKRNWYNPRLLALGILLSIQVLLPLPAMAQPPGQVPMPAANASIFPQGRDYATQVLRTPWDMSQSSQISQGINWIPGNHLVNMQNANGIFSATLEGSNAYFFLLYGGDSNSVKTGRIGPLYPIQPNMFRCIYLAMNLQTQTPDQITLTWGSDQTFSTSGGSGIPVNANNVWKLYRQDLSNPSLHFGASWSSLPQVVWLRVAPSIRAGAVVSVDWVRLTDCNPVNFVLSNLQPGNLSIWVAGSSHQQVRVVDSFSPTNGSYSWDVQGLAAGTYTYYVKNSSGGVVQQGELVVNAAPVIEFLRPSPTSGLDYATQAGNPWDFSDPADTPTVLNASVSYANGLINVTTPTGELPGGYDPILYLNMPTPITNTGAYRYLTYRLYTQWPWQQIPDGMVVRWIWGLPDGCDLVSNQIPFDVGWQTYTIDLSDPYNGAVFSTGGCPPNTPTSWSTTPQVVRQRFDPNENALGQDLFQQIDWVYLTKVDQATRGIPFPIQISLNKPPQGITFAYYYTTSPQQPTQHVASQYAVSPPPPAGSHRLYLPLTLNSTNLTAGGLSFLWNTASVSPGSYYICVTADDTKNQATYCSDAPVVVN